MVQTLEQAIAEVTDLHDADQEQIGRKLRTGLLRIYAFGCFVAVDAVPCRPPAAIVFFVGRLAPADAPLAGTIEPAVPLPRAFRSVAS